MGKNKTTKERHGKSYTSEYKIWDAMIQRCGNPNQAAYKHYGGRGIKVCKRWRISFITFLSDMKNRPSSKYSLNRINNDGDYEPSNCEWTTQKEQMRNIRTNHIIKYKGESKPLVQWAEELGLTANSVLYRLRRGWSVEDAFTPTDGKRTMRTNRMLTHKGITKSLIEWSEEYGLRANTVSTRLGRGWSTEQALFGK